MISNRYKRTECVGVCVSGDWTKCKREKKIETKDKSRNIANRHIEKQKPRRRFQEHRHLDCEYH